MIYWLNKKGKNKDRKNNNNKIIGFKKNLIIIFNFKQIKDNKKK